MPVRFPALPLAALLALVASAQPLVAQNRPSHEHGEDDFGDCGWEGHDDEVRFCTVRERGMGGVKKLDVDPGVNGGVRIIGWSRDSTFIRARVDANASSESAAKAMADQVKIDISGGRIRVSGPRRRDNTPWAVTFVIHVPVRTDVAVTTENGPVDVDGVSGEIHLSATNGPVSLFRLGGNVVARAGNGPLTVDLEGRTWSGKGLDAETTNGPVMLAIPEGYSAQLETGTINGPLSVEVPMTVTLGRNGNGRLNATLGKGGPPVRVVTTNGPATINR